MSDKEATVTGVTSTDESKDKETTKPKEAAKSKTAVKAKEVAKPKEIVITLKKSGIGKPKDQRATIKGLGFKRLNQSITRKDTPEIRGMIKKISHLVQVQ